MAIVGTSGEIRLFEPPVKPSVSMKKMRKSHKKLISDMKFKHKMAMKFARSDMKDCIAAAKAAGKTPEEIAQLSKQLTADIAKREEAFRAQLTEILDAQKAEVEEKKVSFAENYKVDIALWNQKPDITPEQVKELTVAFKTKKVELAQKRLEIKKARAQALASIDEADPSARKLCIAKTKEKYYNLLLDVGEEERVARKEYEETIYSQAKYYKIQQRRKNAASIWRDKTLLFMLIPYLVYFAVYHYAPYVGIQIAFRDYNIRDGIWAGDWIGFKNFEKFLTGPYFPRLLRNTFVINLYGLILGFPAPIIFALLLNEIRSKLFKTVTQTITYLPHFISTVVIAGIVVNFLAPSGLMNHLYVGLMEFFTKQDVDPIYFLMKPEYFRMIYTLMGVWAGFGFGSIVYTSAISGIDQELYEAARIDGAGRWRQTLSITIPSIMPTIAIYLIMRVSHMLQVGYETIILLYQPVTYETADVISTYSYRQGLGSSSGRPDFSMSTSIGLFNGVVSLTLVTIANKISNKIGEVGLW